MVLISIGNGGLITLMLQLINNLLCTQLSERNSMLLVLKTKLITLYQLLSLLVTTKSLLENSKLLDHGNKSLIWLISSILCHMICMEPMTHYPTSKLPSVWRRRVPISKPNTISRSASMFTSNTESNPLKLTLVSLLTVDL